MLVGVPLSGYEGREDCVMNAELGKEQMPQHDTLQRRLQERLAELLQRIGKIEGDLRSMPDPDSEERASERENDEVLEGLDEASLAEVQQIRKALNRIKDGSYGTCSVCGQPISAARLAVVPSADTCVVCAP
jgi:DnaK suppressor protein